MDRLIRIAATSVAAEDIERLRQLVEQVRPRTGDVVRWVDAPEADVLFIDVDSLYGHLDWLQARATGRRVVSIAQRVGGDQQVFLTRPLSTDGLLAALAQYRDELGPAPRDAIEMPLPQRSARISTVRAPDVFDAAPAGVIQMPQKAEPVASEAPTPLFATVAPVLVAIPAVNAATPPAPVRSSAFASELSLAEFCTLEALPRPSRIVHADAPALTIDNEAGVYFGPSGLKALEPYCRGPIARSAWEPVSNAVLEGLRAAGGGQPLVRLLWLNALFGGNGALLGGIDPGSRFRVAKWPQIEREFPRHFRIATAMMKGMATVAEIAAQSGAEPGEVADFINASLVSGHVVMQSPALAADAPEAPQSGFLARFGLRGRKG